MKKRRQSGTVILVKLGATSALAEGCTGKVCHCKGPITKRSGSVFIPQIGMALESLNVKYILKTVTLQPECTHCALCDTSSLLGTGQRVSDIHRTEVWNLLSQG